MSNIDRKSVCALYCILWNDACIMCQICVSHASESFLLSLVVHLCLTGSVEHDATTPFYLRG